MLRDFFRTPLLPVTLIALAIGMITVASAWAQSLPSFPRVSPEAVGFSSDRLTRFEPVLEREIANDMMAGAVVLLARDGKVFYERAAGVKDLRSQAPMTLDTLFRIRSMTKPITGAAGLILVEDGRLRLTDPVSQFIPCFADFQRLESPDGGRFMPLDRPMQVRHLFSHSSGLAYTAPDGRGLGPYGFDTLQAFVEDLCSVQLYFQPGTNYRYSVSNDVLGYVIEQVTGQRLGEFMAERIFEPLGMTDTFFVVPDDKLDRFSTTYDRSESGLVVYDQPDTSVHRNPDSPHGGGGGLISTAEDYLRFTQMLANGGELNGVRILSPHAVKLMTRNHLPTGDGKAQPGPGAGYGLAIGVDGDLGAKGVMGNDGTFYWAGADNSHFFVDPVENIIGIWMTQARPFNYDYAHDLRNLTYQALVGSNGLDKEDNR